MTGLGGDGGLISGSLRYTNIERERYVNVYMDIDATMYLLPT